jgi:hypothetical protein
MSAAPITSVTAFVDWNSQIRASRSSRLAPPIAAGRTLQYVSRVIGKALTNVSSQDKFDVTLRVYHGWRKGFESSVNRKALIGASASADFPTLSRRATVLIRDRIEYGDFLMSAMPSREHPSLACHLPNTFRKAINDETREEEKMVDTALASDVVDLAHHSSTTWILVIGDDDDLVPPSFVAEAVRNGKPGRVVLVRNRPCTVFLKLDGLGYRP